MKKVTLIVLLFISIQSFAQKVTQKIVLTTGQKINVNQVDDTNMTISAMGQEINITGSNSSTAILEIKTVADNNNVITRTLKKVKISSEAMGQSQSYDSENAADKNSDMAKQFEDKLNKPEDFNIDNKGKEITNSKKTVETDGDNPMENILKMADVGINNVSSSFMVLPADVKAGFSWTDSSTIDKIKTVKKYTVKSIDNTDAVIALESNNIGEKSVDAQGTEMNININVTVNGEMTSDIATGLVKKNVLSADINNTMDIMGSSSPMTGKITSTVIYTPAQ